MDPPLLDLPLPPIFRSFSTLPIIPAQVFALHAATGIALYVLALLSLSYALSENWPAILKASPTAQDRHTPDQVASLHSVLRTRLLGAIAATALLAVPLTCPSSSPLVHLPLRVLAVFYACKLLDLTVARAAKPPVWISNGAPVPLQTVKARAKYVCLLLTEFRYYSFTSSVPHPGRDHTPSKRAIYGPYLLIPLLASLFPCAETGSLLVLLAIAGSLEVAHTLLHPRCRHPLFWQPFAARTLSAFWKTHWQQAASPFLFSLGYRPAKTVFTRVAGKRVGRAAGVLAAFALSGAWHGWAAAALSATPWRTGLGLAALFVAHGLGCVLEQQLLLEGRRASLVYALVVWSVALWAAGAWARDALPRSNLEFVVRLWREAQSGRASMLGNVL